MRKVWIVLAMLAVLLTGGWARAQEEQGALERVVDSLELSGWQEEADFDVRGLILELCAKPEAVDWEGLLSQVKAKLIQVLAFVPGALLSLTVPALLCALNRRFLTGELAQAAQLVCYLGEAQALIALFLGELTSARSAIERVGGLTEKVYPVLLTLLSMTGGNAAAGVMRPLYAFLSGALSSGLYRSAFVLASCAAAVAAAGRLSPDVRLHGLLKLLTSVSGYLTGACMTAFLAILTAGGLLGAARDGVTIRAAKYAIDSLLPVVGGEVAGAMDAVTLSAALVRNAAGITGLVLMLGVCLAPIARLVACMLICRVAGALVEPLHAGEISACLQDFSSVLRILLIALCACAVLFVILVGAALRAGTLVFAMR